MLSRFTKPGFRDRFTVSFLDRNGHMIKMRVYRRRWLGTLTWSGTVSIGGECILEIQSPDPDMITHSLVREAWNRDNATTQKPRRAVIAD